MNNLYDEAAEWITENFPPPEVSDHEAAQIQALAIRKAMVLRQLTIRLESCVYAFNRVESGLSLLENNINFTPTFEEEVNDIQQKEGFWDHLFSEMTHDTWGFMSGLQRAVADGFDMFREPDPNDRLDLLVGLGVIFHLYTYVFPRMRSISASFLMRIGLAEVQFSTVGTATIEYIQSSGESLDLKIKAAKARDKVLSPNREEVIRIYLEMSEEDRWMFSEKGKMATFYKKFKAQAVKSNAKWKKGKKEKNTPPSRNTVQDYIDKYIFNELLKEKLNEDYEKEHTKVASEASR